jgi:hypothetical protein
VFNTDVLEPGMQGDPTTPTNMAHNRPRNPNGNDDNVNQADGEGNQNNGAGSQNNDTGKEVRITIRVRKSE